MPFTIQSVSGDEFVRTIHDAGTNVPVEQSPAWARYDDSLPGRQHWRYLVVLDAGTPVAALSLTEFTGRALVQLWAKFGPVWLTPQPPSADAELELRRTLRTYVLAEYPRVALVRLHAAHAAPDLSEPLIEVFYDRTLVLDLTPSEDELLAAMSKSGRRDLRYGLKNAELTFADETDIDETRFTDEVFPVFTETARRGDFELRPAAFYFNMLRELGPQICRLYTVRDASLGGAVVAWAFVTIHEGEARYFYAATTAAARKNFAANRMVWECMLAAKQRGATTFDFMGLGSERAPALGSLDGFKLKFGKDGARDVPGPWDLVLRPRLLTAHHASRKATTTMTDLHRQAPSVLRSAPTKAARAVSALATTAGARLAARAMATTPSATAGEGATPAVLPVVLDFTLSGYALARAFHERYGLTSVLAVPFTTGATADSTLFHETRELGQGAINDHALVLDAVRDIAAANPDLTVIPLTNNDGYVQSLSAARETLGSNVVVPHESPDMLVRISDKNHFNAVCAEAGVATPGTVVLDFAAGRPSTEAVTFPYPIIVKPADSALHNALSMPGKKKLYEVATAGELDALVERLAAAGYTGEMLAQDHIPGDDILSVTVYRAKNGEITLARTSKVLLQDPRPAFLGIPDVQVVQNMPDVVDASRRILETAGYFGFANLDAIRDPRDGSVKFFEVNPRYGRNCFYATASGANVAEQLVTDLVEGRPMAAPALTHELVYTVLPPRVLTRLLPAGAERDAVARLVEAGRWADPLKYRGEKNPKHKAYAQIAAWNHARAYRGAPRVIGG